MQEVICRRWFKDLTQFNTKGPSYTKAAQNIWKTKLTCVSLVFGLVYYHGIPVMYK